MSSEANAHQNQPINRAGRLAGRRAAQKVRADIVPRPPRIMALVERVGKRWANQAMG
jgi:hypothetical protein